MKFISNLPAHCATMLLITVAVLPLHAAVDLKVDVNDRDNNTAPNTESGFTPFAIAGTGTAVVLGSTAHSLVVGAQTVTISGTASGTGTLNSYDDRKRAAPLASGTFTQTALLQDFIFATYSAVNNVNAGLDISISGLEANKAYDVTLWSFDASSTGTRVSDWSANGTLKVNNYTFGGATAPTTNERYQINFTANSNASGVLLIAGRRDTTSVDNASAATHGVFLNALWVRDSLDSEPDGMNDVWEANNGLVVGVNDAALDADSDFSTNLEEFLANTNPRDNDSDDDGLFDGYEKKTGTWGGPTAAGTDPLNPDTDSDGLGDALENPDLPYTGPAQPGTNPNLADTDGDTFFDGEEVQWPTDPRNIAVFPNPGAGATLAIDTENIAPVAQPGFQAFLGSGAAPASPAPPITSLSTAYGPYNVTISAVGTTSLESRDRGTTSARGGFTPMFRDFIFSPTSDNDGDGMDITITGLAANTWYPVTLWSWDPTSAATPRHSTWLALEGGVPVVKVPLYSLEGTTPLPSSGRDRRMKFDALSDGAGTLVIQGRRETGYALPPPAVTPTINVFLNAFVIGPPVTPLRFTAIGQNQFTFTSDDIGTYEVLASPDLVQWFNIAPAVDGQPGTTTWVDPVAPPPPIRRFFQVRRVSP